MKSLFSPVNFLVLSFLITVYSSCTTVDLYEKNITIPGQKWKSSFKPEFSFDITDSTAYYKISFLIRHTARYNYNNIWINLYSQPPGDSTRKVPYEITLATDTKGWLGTGMDDVYDQRQKLTDGIKLKPGTYKFSIEQIMREDPLEHILSVGLRVEKVK